jgi:hypothetical protein
MNKIGMSKPNASHKIIFYDNSDFVRGGVGGQGQGSAESIRRAAAIGLHTPI